MNNFKRAQVVILPTNDSQTKNQKVVTLSIGEKYAGDLKAPINHHLYIISDDKIKEGDWFIGDGVSLKQCTLNNGGNINFKGGWYSGSSNCKKIISSTDKSLITGRKIMPDGSIFDANSDWDIKYGVKSGFGLQRIQRDETLPQPPQQFIENYIESYNKGEIITDVLVEYEEQSNCTNYITESCVKVCLSCSNLKLKVNTKNEITIKKNKDGYSREEHIKGLKSLALNIIATYRSGCRVSELNVDKWISENI